MSNKVEISASSLQVLKDSVVQDLMSNAFLHEETIEVHENAVEEASEVLSEYRKNE